MNTQPVDASERAEILDVLRGLAILGIFLANSFSFSGFIYLDESQRQSLPTAPIDHWLTYFSTTFIQGKFYSLFSLLFGIGFSIILIRSTRKGLSGTKLFYRRLIVLLLIGLFHAWLLWDGDILVLYAVLGMLLPLLKNVGNKGLLSTAVVLLLLPILIDTARLAFEISPGEPLRKIAMSIDAENGLPSDPSVAYYLYTETSGFAEIFHWNAGGFFYRYAFLLDSNRLPKVLAMFLIGFYAGRKMIYANIASHVPLLKRLQVYGFAIGLPFSVAMAFFEKDGYSVPKHWLGLTDTVLYAVSVVPLSLAYTSTIALLWHRGILKKLWIRIAAVGRMALTNYISQSVLGILIYYNIGLGMGVKFGPALFYPIAILVYVSQVIWSNAWLSRYPFGPLEWIWRKLTYGKMPSLMTSSSVPVQTKD
jgi:uncharacterized protein